MRSPLLTALFHPLNIMMAVLMVFAGLLSAWWLFPVGLVFWLVMVIALSRDRALRLNHEMQSRAPLAQRFQRYFDRIQRAQVSVFNTLSASPARTRQALQPIQVEVDRVAQQAHALCQRMTTLENYRLVTQSQSKLTDDLAHIDQLIEATDDATLRQEYLESRTALEARLSKLEGVATQLYRVDAQLLNLANELDGVVTEVVRLQAISPADADVYVSKIVNRLQGEAEQLRTFERRAIRV